MVLLVSDMHFGRAAPAADRALERALIACLRAHEDALDALVLLGDVFDEYVEYPSLVPKGCARLQGYLAHLTDSGVPVTYLVGNHDPWHRDYFERELGVRVVFGERVETFYGRRVYLYHGDGLDPEDAAYNRLKPLLRHPVPVWIYTHLLPGDLGLRLARRVNRRVMDEQVHASTVVALRRHARAQLRQGHDVVVMGHAHFAEHQRWPDGDYVNTGAWYKMQTFVRLDEAGARLMRWNGRAAEAWMPESEAADAAR